MTFPHADLTLAQHANAYAVHHDGVEDVARAYAGASEAVFLAGVVVLFLVGLALRRDRLVVAAVLSVLAAGAALAVGMVVSALVDRPRPFTGHTGIHLFVAHAADPGFPSDHATAAFAIAAMLLLVLGARTLPVLLAAVALAVSRVMVGLHYPADVVAGALIGSIAAVAIWAIAHHPAVSRRAARARAALAPHAGAAAAPR
jgi:undecaprenyl-diphosphatase